MKETAAEIDQCSRQLALSRTSWSSAGEAIQASQRSITSIGKQMKTAESSYRLAAAGVKDFDKSAAGLTAKLTLLQEKMGLQQKAVAEYEKALAAAKEQLQAAQQVNDPDKIREATDAVQDAETALNNARAAVKQTQADIVEMNAAIQAMIKAAEEAGEEVPESVQAAADALAAVKDTAITADDLFPDDVAESVKSMFSGIDGETTEVYASLNCDALATAYDA